jgi:Secretion system C-terminal sorting domain/FG-GAP-like repeat
VSGLFTSLGCADVNGDGRIEGYLAYVRADSLFLQRFGDDGFRMFRIGHRLPEGYVTREVERAWLSFGDLDRAAGGTLEVVVTTESGLVTVLDGVLDPLPGWPKLLPQTPISGPAALGDLDGDGLLEVVVSCGLRSIHAFNYNGTEMAGWPVHVDLVDYPLPALHPSSPSIADADGDGRQDVILGFTDFTIHAISSDGKDAEGFPIPAGAATAGSPAILDANGDGRLDMFLQSGDGKVMAHVLAGTASATNPQWPMFGGGPRLHGAFDASRMPVIGFASGRVLDGPAVVYPNPVRTVHGDVHVRYTLEPGLAAATQVNVSIFNTAGEKVLSRSGSAFANTENEVVFGVHELASGVYFCTVRARSGANVETSQTKFAVIR